MNGPGISYISQSVVEKSAFAPYYNQLCQTPHVLFRGSDRGRAISLTLDTFQACGADFEETRFWVSETQDTWDVTLDSSPASFTKEVMRYFHCWSLDKNQATVRQGIVQEESILIDVEVSQQLLQRMLGEQGDELLRNLALALNHLDELGWVFMVPHEWEMDANILLVSERCREQYLTIIKTAHELSLQAFMFEC